MTKDFSAPPLLSPAPAINFDPDCCSSVLRDLRASTLAVPQPISNGMTLFKSKLDYFILLLKIPQWLPEGESLRTIYSFYMLPLLPCWEPPPSILPTWLTLLQIYWCLHCSSNIPGMLQTQGFMLAVLSAWNGLSCSKSLLKYHLLTRPYLI